MFTFHPGFCKETEEFLAHQQQKSMLISGAAEKERSKFFNRMYERIHALKQKL